MRIEMLPILLGILIALIGGAMIYDAAGDPESGPLRERRRRIRASIDRHGEYLVGIGTFLLGAALIGQDSWRYGTLAVLVGTVCVLWGGFRNRHYIREIFLYRGASRRGMKKDQERPFDKKTRLRIR